MPALGWHFSDDDASNRRRLTIEDEPRIEMDHTYIMAISWRDQHCSPGESDYSPAEWLGLGSDSILPYDDGLIGQGELEGRVQAAEQARVPEKTEDFSLEDSLAGESADSLVAKLKAAKATSRVTPPRSGNSDCG